MFIAIVSERAICIYVCKVETLAGLRYAQITMVTACGQGERGSMSDSGCKESSLPVCTYTFGCLLAGETVFCSRPRRRLLFVAVAYLGGFNPPPPKFRRLSKIVPNSTRL